MLNSTQSTDSGQPVSQEIMAPGSAELVVVHEGNSTTFITQAQDEEEAPQLPIVLRKLLPPPVVFQPSQVLNVTDVTSHRNN